MARWSIGAVSNQQLYSTVTTSETHGRWFRQLATMIIPENGSLETVACVCTQLFETEAECTSAFQPAVIIGARIAARQLLLQTKELGLGLYRIRILSLVSVFKRSRGIRMRRGGSTCRTMAVGKIALGSGFCAATTAGRHGVPSLKDCLRT